MISLAPLFHARVLQEHRNKFAFPQDLTDRYEQFLSLCYRMRKIKEPVVYLQVIHALFCGVLGYLSPFEGSEIWEIDLNDRVYLGYFNFDKISPSIEILWGEMPYKIEFNPSIDWLITIDFEFISLFYKDYSNLFGQSFALTQLRDQDELELFYSIFCRRNLLGNPLQPTQARVYQLLEMTTIVEDNLSREFYRYLFQLQQKLQKDISYRLQQLSIGQKDLDKKITRLILYRLILLQGMTDRGLLPVNLLQDAYNFVNPYRIQPVWINYRAIFRWIEEGNQNQAVPCLEIDFFGSNDTLDRLIHIGDELCRQMKEVSQFNLKDDIYPLLLSFLLVHLVSNKKINFRKWRSHKFLQEVFPTWNCLTSLNIESPSQTYFFAQDCNIGLSLLVAFAFLKMLYRNNITDQEIPTNKEIIGQLAGTDRDEEKIEITKLIFYLLFGTIPHLELNKPNLPQDYPERKWVNLN